MKTNILTYNDIHSILTSRMVSNGIIVNDKTVAEMRRIEESLSRLQAMGDDRMALRAYMNLWAKCYLAVYPEKDEKKSPKELFEWYSSKGCAALKFNLDCEEDFVRWKAENSYYHCLDVVYARVHLWVLKDKTTGKFMHWLHRSMITLWLS